VVLHRLDPVEKPLGRARNVVEDLERIRRQGGRLVEKGGDADVGEGLYDLVGGDLTQKFVANDIKRVDLASRKHSEVTVQKVDPEWQEKKVFVWWLFHGCLKPFRMNHNENENGEGHLSNA
jgi:hypothetical protein